MERHAKYDQYQYLPRVITRAENDHVVMLALLFGAAPPSLGLIDDLKYLAARLREVWPDVHISLRADSGFATPHVYNGCEDLGIRYTIGLKVAAEIVVNVRRVRVRLSGSWLFLDHYRAVSQAVNAACARLWGADAGFSSDSG